MDERNNHNKRNPIKRAKSEGLTLFFGNLSNKVDADLLLELVAQVGVVSNIKLIPGKDAEKDKGYAFIELASKEDASYVQTVLDGIQLYGEKLFVQYEKRRDNNTTK